MLFLYVYLAIGFAFGVFGIFCHRRDSIHKVDFLEVIIYLIALVLATLFYPIYIISYIVKETEEE